MKIKTKLDNVIDDICHLQVLRYSDKHNLTAKYPTDVWANMMVIRKERMKSKVQQMVYKVSL
jgi:hypothetical protein